MSELLSLKIEHHLQHLQNDSLYYIQKSWLNCKRWPLQKLSCVLVAQESHTAQLNLKHRNNQFPVNYALLKEECNMQAMTIELTSAIHFAYIWMPISI